MLSRRYQGVLIQTGVRTDKNGSEFAGYLDLKRKYVEWWRALAATLYLLAVRSKAHCKPGLSFLTYKTALSVVAVTAK